MTALFSVLTLWPGFCLTVLKLESKHRAEKKITHQNAIPGKVLKSIGPERVRVPQERLRRGAHPATRGSCAPYSPAVRLIGLFAVQVLNC